MQRREEGEVEIKAIAVRVTVVEMAAVFLTTAVEKTMKMIALTQRIATRAAAIIVVTIVIIIAIKAQSTNASLPDLEINVPQSAVNAAGRAINRLQSVAKSRLTKV